MKTENYPIKNSVTRLLSMLILVMLFAAGIGSGANAQTNQTYTIGGAGYYSSTVGPFNCQYTDLRTSYLYKASEISAATGWYSGCPMSINSLAFRVYVLAVPLNYAGFTIKMQNTTNTTNAALVTAGYTTVYSGNFYLNSTGWQTFNFTTPFVWDGVSNLLIETCWDNYLYYATSPYNPVYGDVISGYTPTNRTYSTSNPVGGVCNLNSVSGTSTFRPQLQIVAGVADPQTPGALTLSNPTSTSFDMNIFPWNWNNVVLVASEGSNTITTPSGTPPAVGQPFAGGTLIYNGLVFPQTYTFANPTGAAKTWYVRAWTFNGLNYSCASQTQSISTPCALLKPTGFTAVLSGTSAALLNITGLYMDNPVVVIRSTSSGSFTTPSGPPPAVGQPFAGGTLVVYGTDFPYLNTGLIGPTTYYYRAYSYNGTTYSCDYTQASVVTPCLPLAPASITVSQPGQGVLNVNVAGSPDNDKIVIIWNTTGSFSTPTGTMPPAVGDAVGGGTVLYAGVPAAVNHNGLTAGLTYYYRAYSYVYDPGPPSEFAYSCNYVSGSKLVEVPCAYVPPYNEGFEAITAANTLPPCVSATSFYGSSGSYYTYTGIGPYGSYNRGPRTGDDYGYFRYGCNDWFFFGPVNVSAGTSYDFGFWYVTDGYSGWTNLDLAVGSAPNAASMTYVSSLTNVINTTYQKMSYTTCAPADASVYIGVHCTGNGVPWYLSIDDIFVEATSPQPPTPPAPTACPTLNPANNAVNVSTTVKLNWSAVANATGYQVYLGPTNNPPLVNTVLGLAYSPGGLTPNTDYFWRVVPIGCGGSATCSTVYTFKTSALPGVTCTPSFSYTSDEDLGYVKLNTLEYSFPGFPSTTGQCAPLPQYSDLTYMGTDLKRGNTYTLKITKDDCENSSFWSYSNSAYIDFNGDGTFNTNMYNTPGGELLGSQYVSTGTISRDTITTFITFTIPAGVPLGYARLRIVLNESSTVPVIPCISGYYGEGADFYVNIYDVAITNELAVTEWVQPTTACGLTATESVKVKVKNNSINPVAAGAYTMSFFNGTTWVSEPGNMAIANGATVTYTFSAAGDFSTMGAMACKVAVYLAGDQNTANDTLKNINVFNSPKITVTPTTPYLDNFEGTSTWVKGGNANSSWVLGTPAKTHIVGAASGTKAWVTKTTGNYNQGEFGWVESPCFDLTALSMPAVQMDIAYKTEVFYDGANLEYSTDDGLTWVLIGTLGANSTWYNQTVNSMPMYKVGWGSTSATGYSMAKITVPSLANTGNIRFRVFFSSNNTIVNEGFAFDNFRVYQETALSAYLPAAATIELPNGIPMPLTVVGGTPPYSAVWTPTNGLSCSNCLVPTVMPLVTTTYTGVITDSSPAKASVNVGPFTVTVIPELILDLLPSSAVVCDTAITQLNAFVTGGQPPYTYAWAPAAGLSATNIANPICTTHSSQIYTVTVTDNLGFTKVGVVPVTVVHGYPVVDVFPQTVQQVCVGDSVLLTAVGGTGYTWGSVPGGQIIRTPNAPTTWVIPTVSGAKFSCTVTAPCGTASDFAVINFVRPRPTPSLTLPLSSICVNGGPVTLTGGTPAGGTYSGSGVVAGVFYPALVGPGIKTITYSTVNVYGCIGMATDQIEVYPKPIVALTLNPTSVCINTAAYALTGGTPAGGTYSGNGVNSLTGIFNPALAGAGVHSIKYKYANEYGCLDSAAANLTVWDLTPTTLVLSPKQVCVNATAPITLTGGTPTGGTYTYTGPVGGIVSPNKFYPAIAGVGTWTITYSYKDTHGCTNIGQDTIRVNPIPVISTDAQNVSICAGEETSVQVNLLTGIAPWYVVYKLSTKASNDTLKVASGNVGTIYLSPSSTATVTFLKVVDGYGCANTSVPASFIVTVVPRPAQYHVVFNDIWPEYGHVCANAGGLYVGLNGSQVGVTYELYRTVDGVTTFTGQTFTNANGTDFWFLLPENTEGDYTVKAIGVAPTSCEQWMVGNPHLYLDTLEMKVFSEFPEICAGGTSIMKAVIFHPEISVGEYLFDWGPDADIDHDGFDSIVAHPTVSKWIVATAWDTTGCMAKDSFFLVVNGLPTVDITNGATIGLCSGQSVQLNTTFTTPDPTTITGYSWSPAAGLSATNIANPVANPTESTVYHVTIFNSKGCEGYDEIAINVTNSPAVEFTGGNNGNVCVGGYKTLPLVVTSPGPNTFAWAPTAELNDLSIQNPVATPVGSGSHVYTVTVTNTGTGCFTIANYTLLVDDTLEIEAGPYFNLCNTLSANLNVDITEAGYPPFIYSWTAVPPAVWIPGSQTTKNPSAVPQSNTNTWFYVTVTDAHGCQATDSTLVTTSGIATAHGGPDRTICQGQSVTMIGSGGPTYQWFYAGGDSITPVSNNPSVTVTPSVTTTYELRVNSPCGVAFTYVTITVNPATAVSISIPQTVFCQNGPAVTVTGTPTNSNGHFTGTGITDNNNGTASFSPTTPGTYNITYAYTNQYGCTYSAVKSVTVNALPEVTLAPLADVCISVAPFALTGGLPAGGTYSGTGVLSGTTFVPPLAGVGTYTITYTYTNSNGCTNSATSSITVLPIPQLFAVTAENNGHFCANDADGVIIYLSGSEPFESGVKYYLTIDGMYTGNYKYGTGSPIQFNGITTTGTIKVIAGYPSGCTREMNGSVLVVVDPLPWLYTVSGGGEYCLNGDGVSISLDNSNTGINYELYLGATLMASQAGVNGPLTFENVSVVGTYTVLAVNPVTGCSVQMNGSATVSTLPLPVQFPVSIDNNHLDTIICPGSPVTIRLMFREVSTYYYLWSDQLNDTIPGSLRKFTQGNTLWWTYNNLDPGTYRVWGWRPSTGCSDFMRNSVTIYNYDLLTIETQPADQYIDANQNATFSAVVNGSLPVYQWYVSPDGFTWVPVVDGGTAPQYSGANSNTLDVLNAPYSITRYMYKLETSSPCGTVYTDPAVLYIDPVLHVYPGTFEVCAANEILWPIYIEHADSIAAISLTMYYHNPDFIFNGVTNLSPYLNQNPLVFSAPGSQKIVFSYFSNPDPSAGPPVINTNDGTIKLMDLKFNVANAGGTCDFIEFDLVNQGASELAKESTEILTTVFSNGEVCVSPLPIITEAKAADADLCEDEDLFLMANAYHPEGVSYHWTGPDNWTSDEQYPVRMGVTPDMTGTYCLTVTSLENLCVATTCFHVDVWPKPKVDTVYLPGDSLACAGSGVEVAMMGSELGVIYQLYNGINPVAAPDGIAIGTGGPITFGPQPISGNYSVVGTTIHGCKQDMFGNPHIQINPLPLWFYVQGGGHYCAGGAGKEIKLSGSQIGVNYTLLLNACCCQWDSIMGTIPGTGSPISFGFQTTPGYYSVVAVSTMAPYCQNNMIGCIPIIIDPLPTACITGGDPICYGTTDELTLTLTGTPPFIVTLTANGGDPFVVTPNPTTSPWNFLVNPAVTTVYQVVSVTDNNGCTTNYNGNGCSTTVEVYELPVVSCEPVTVCEEQTIQLNATATGFAPLSFSWTGPNGFSSTEEDPIITDATLEMGGQYILTVTDGHNCVNFCYSTVVVNPLPDIETSGSSACVGSTLYLHAEAIGNGPFSYYWLTPAGDTLFDQNPEITPAELSDAGIYTVVVTDANGCENTATAELIVFELPLVSCGSNSPVCFGDTIKLTAEGTGFGEVQYSWTGPNGFTSTLQNPVIENSTFDNGGTYIVSVMDEHQCVNTCSVEVVVLPLPVPCVVRVTEPNVYCFGCVPPKIWLSCSEDGVSYELYFGATATGNIVLGKLDNDSINFGHVSAQGWYKVLATNITTGCQNWMTDSVQIIEQAPPTAVMTGDVICVGEQAELKIELTGDSFWYLVISDGVLKDTVYTDVTPYYYQPGVSGNHIQNPTVNTTFTILLVSDRVCYNVGNSAVVVVNPNPNKFTLIGGGYYCNGIGVNVGLNGSQPGITYVLRRNGLEVATMTGTGAQINFGPQADGFYTAYAINPNTGCVSEMNGGVYVLPDPGITGYITSVDNGYICAGQSVCINLSGSQAGKEYKLIKDGIYTNLSIIGTGDPIQFCNISEAGVYTILAFDPITTCTRLMDGFATIVVYDLPTATIAGDATICYSESTPLHITLTGLAPWYFVITDGTYGTLHMVSTTTYDTIVTPLATANYWITTVSDAHCQGITFDTAHIIVLGPTPYIMTGGGVYCEGGQGVIIGLSGSQNGVSYELYLNSVPTGNIVTGTGSAISFGYQTLAGVYTVKATDPVTGCSRMMNGSSVITIHPLPATFNVTGGGACCVGCTHVFVCLDGSQVGVKYELFINGIATGILKYGNGLGFCYPYATVAGIYTIKATNMQTGCWTWMNGEAEVILYPTAQAHIQGNNTMCNGDSTLITVTFNAGTPPFSFGLLHTGSSVPEVYSGITANPFEFYVHPSVSTTYTLAWVSDFYGCYNNQTTGAATITIYQLPGVSFELPDNEICDHSPAFPLTGGNATVPGTGVYSGDGVYDGWFYADSVGAGSWTLTYTFTAENGCIGSESTIITVVPLPVVTFEGLGDAYCADGEPVTLIGWPAYGYFVGAGITDYLDGTALFDPEFAGQGTHQIYYYYTDPETGCMNYFMDETEVKAVPDVSFSGFNQAVYCLNAAPVTLTGTPEGGTFTGMGISGNVFNPMDAGVGIHTITYAYYDTYYCYGDFSMEIEVLPLPTVCDFNGNDTCCIGCSVPAILACSDEGVIYQLMWNGNQPVQAPKVGTGGILVWDVYIGGNYTVVATSPVTGCSVTMPGTYVVVITPQPAATLSGTAITCEESCTTVHAVMSGVPPFTLFFTDGQDTLAVNLPDGVYTWDTLVCPEVTTTYWLANLQDKYCGGLPSNPITITVLDHPEIFNVVGGGIVCQGTEGVTVGLDGSTDGTYYSLYRNGVSIGMIVEGDGNAISFGPIAVAGDYTVVSMMNQTNCERLMDGTVTITVIDLPVVGIELPQTVICENAAPFMLSGGYPATDGYFMINGGTVIEFDPAIYGAGPVTVNWVYTDPITGCTNIASQVVEVYALPPVSLDNSWELCFDADPITLSGGYPEGGTYHINGNLVTGFNPMDYGVGTYEVYYEYIDPVTGCSNSDMSSITVHALPNVTLGQFADVCQGEDAFTLTGGLPLGGTYYVDGVAATTFNPIATGIFVITYVYTNEFGCTNSATQELTVNLCALYAIEGKVTYDNSIHTVMNSTNGITTVELWHNSTFLSSINTDVNGNYSFTSIAPGTYTVKASSAKTWGGANSADALLIMKHFSGMISLAPLRALAADVDANGQINANDALWVARRFVNKVNYFPAGDWVFDVKTFTVTNTTYINDFKAICFGDVNGSYTPPYVKVQPTINLSPMGVKEVNSYETFELPISVVGNLRVGAISLVMNYNEDLFEIDGITINNNFTKDLLYTTINGELRISWYSMKEMELSDKDVLISITVKTRNIDHASSSDLGLMLNAISELSDKNATVIQNARLTYPKLTLPVKEYTISNYPNPFSTVTEISYSLPESGNVSLRVYNLLGEQVSVLIDNVPQNASTYKVTFDGTNMNPGIYTYKFEVRGESGSFMKTGMMVLSK